AVPPLAERCGRCKAVAVHRSLFRPRRAELRVEGLALPVHDLGLPCHARGLVRVDRRRGIRYLRAARAEAERSDGARVPGPRGRDAHSVLPPVRRGAVMRRRDAAVALVLAVAFARTPRAQQSDRVRRMAMLLGVNDEFWQAYLVALEQHMSELGWSEG